MKNKKTYKELAIEFKNSKSDKSFTELYNKMRPGLRNYVYNIIKDADAADDITSVTLTTVHQKIDQYDETYQISTWAYRIAYNQCIGWLRAKKSRVSIDSFKDKGMETSDTGLLPFQDLFEYDNEFMNIEDEHAHKESILMEKFNKIIDAIKALPPMYRGYMEERFINNQSYDNILDIMKKHEPNINQQTVKNRIFRGRRIIKSQLESLNIFHEID